MVPALSCRQTLARTCQKLLYAITVRKPNNKREWKRGSAWYSLTGVRNKALTTGKEGNKFAIAE